MNDCCQADKVDREEVYRIDMKNPTQSEKIIYSVCPVCGTTKTEKQEEEA